jgi:hypothetical protein
LPETLDEARGWGIEPGGGVRSIVGGVRVLSMPDGAMMAATDRLPATPSCVIALPERLGGGFLFAIGAHLWRAPAWLGTAYAYFASPVPVSQILVGLDRVYVRSQQGALAALDPRSGSQVGLGPLPASPHIGRLAALDAWHAVAIADLRGAMWTTDAGSTWRQLALPIEPSEVIALDNSIAVGGTDEARQMQWWEVRSDGQTDKLSVAPPAGPAPDRPPAPIDAMTKAFGPRPLALAVEDGWPLTDGTAIVARDGAVGRIRLADGVVVESVIDAFPLKPARCHPLSLARGQDHNDGAVGFACGESRGRTVIYRWEPPTGRLVELRRFENPREVLGFGNGALAVRGSCVAGAAGEAVGNEQAWCAMLAGGAWSEIRRPSDERLVILADGRAASVRPPRAGDLSTALLTISDGTHDQALPITLPLLHSDAARALRLGLWMDGFEERRAGVVGGWVEAGGSILGIEVGVDGQARVGEYIRDAGAPVPSGRWAFGWTASRRGFETTDGGMTWIKEISLPDPIASGRLVHERACGPVGCIVAGWLRVGWGTPKQAPASEPRPRTPPPLHGPPRLELDCEPLAGPPPDPPAAPARNASRLARGSAPPPSPASLYAGTTWGAVTELPTFAGRGGPAKPADDLGLSIDASNGIERALRAVPLARIYAWGPKTGEWDQLGRWQVLWQWPWGGWQDVRSSAVAAAPWTSLEGARRALGMGPAVATAWSMAESDDADHALLFARRTLGAVAIDALLLETDRPPVEAHRAGGEPFPDVEGAARLQGRWYIAATQSPGELAATVVWSLDGATAREFIRVPRAGFETRPALRLARRTDGRALGLVVDGQTDAMRGTTPRWVAGMDIETSSLSTPEPLAPVDLSDRPVSLCTEEDSGWEVDLPYPGTVRLRIGARWESALQSPVARMRFSRDRACVQRVLGSVDGYGSAPAQALTKGQHSSVPSRAGQGVGPRGADDKPGHLGAIEASVFSARLRYGLRCTAR